MHEFYQPGICNLFMTSINCSKCLISFSNRDNYLKHIQQKHLKALIISTDKGYSVAFSRTAPGKFTCPTCYSVCDNIHDVLVHIFCEDLSKPKIEVGLESEINNEFAVKTQINCVPPVQSYTENNMPKHWDMQYNLPNQKLNDYIEQDNNEVDFFNFLLTSSDLFTKESNVTNQLECKTKFKPLNNIQKKRKIQWDMEAENQQETLVNNSRDFLKYSTKNKSMNLSDSSNQNFKTVVLNEKDFTDEFNCPVIVNSGYIYPFDSSLSEASKIGVNPRISSGGEKFTTTPKVNQRRRSNTRVNNAVNSSPIFEQFSTIMLRYINSTKVINTLFSKIESIPDNGHIQWSEIMRSIPFLSRPDTDIGRQMMIELNDAGFIVTIIYKTNMYKIRKGPIFPT